MSQQLLLSQNTNNQGLSLVLPDLEVSKNVQGSNTFSQLAHSAGQEDIKNNSYDKDLRAIIETAPKIIKDICWRYTSIEELTMALFSAITLTGSILPEVKVNYHNKMCYPALMLLIVFPPASGKGCLSSIRKLISKINAELIDKNKNVMREYKLKTDQYKKSLKSDSFDLPPEKPNLPMLLMPGDVTSAKLIEQLSQNGPEQPLMIFETEADAFGVSASNKQYGSQISTVLRKSFEFETVSQARKTEGELLITETPKLVMVLSGTESQIAKIFPSNDDGLFSRFMIVTGNASPKWMDVKPDSTKVSQDNFFETMADKYYEMWKFFIGKDIEVKFTDAQWNQINAFGERNLAMTHHFKGELTGSMAKRHANMIVRLATTLTMFQYFDNKSEIPVAFCKDQFFDIAIWMAEHSLKWSLDLFKKLPEKIKNEVPLQKLLLLDNLPEFFSLKEVEKLVPGIKLSERTLSRWVNEFVASGYLTRLQHGKYRKMFMAYMAVAEIKNEGQ
ncbi:MAG: hypothetical protein JWP37_30 [Mucilaginibacter sp.]|nr:hypothetical protein [Mucilaginibacter sp.]